MQETEAKNKYERIPNDKNLTQANEPQIFAAENTHSINKGLAFGCYIHQYFQTYIQQYIHRYGNFLLAVDEPVVEDIRTLLFSTDGGFRTFVSRIGTNLPNLLADSVILGTFRIFLLLYRTLQLMEAAQIRSRSVLYRTFSFTSYTAFSKTYIH